MYQSGWVSFPCTYGCLLQAVSSLSLGKLNLGVFSVGLINDTVFAPSTHFEPFDEWVVFVRGRVGGHGGGGHWNLFQKACSALQDTQMRTVTHCRSCQSEMLSHSTMGTRVLGSLSNYYYSADLCYIFP